MSGIIALAHTRAHTPRMGLIDPRALIFIWVLRGAIFVLILGSWMGANVSGSVPKFILPSFGDVMRIMGKELIGPTLWQAAAVTLGAILIAAVIAVVVGVGISFVLSHNWRTATTVEPLFAWGYIFPFELLYPLFLVWFGVGIESKIAYGVVSAVFPIAYNTMRGLRAVPARYLDVGRAFGASRRQVDWHIKLGAARPMILSGLRLGISLVAISVVLGEVLGSNAGLGFEIQQAVNTLQVAKSYAYILFIVIVSAAVMLLSERVFGNRRT